MGGKQHADGNERKGCAKTGGRDAGETGANDFRCCVHGSSLCLPSIDGFLFFESQSTILQRLPNLSRPEMPVFLPNGGCSRHKQGAPGIALHNVFYLFEIKISPEWLSLTNRPCTGWDMSAIQIMGFGLTIIWAASFVFLGYLLLPTRSELDQSN
jgi:hypothetical protein